jgi:hypothetical protein
MSMDGRRRAMAIGPKMPAALRHSAPPQAKPKVAVAAPPISAGNTVAMAGGWDDF